MECNRIGEEKLMKCGDVAKIIKYNNSHDITIKFNYTNEIIRNVLYSDFKKGSIKSHYYPTVCGVGVLGKEKMKNNGKECIQYTTWHSMLKRCYDIKYKKESYCDCSVCEEWLYYPNFKKWYDSNYYKINNEVMELDKDILFKGNKIYSPDTCIFVPKRINLLFVNRKLHRGKYPLGVTYDKNRNLFSSHLNDINTKRIYLGRYRTCEEAFNIYKQFKENYIKEIAEEYKNKIPKELYDAMYRWEVEITD